MSQEIIFVSVEEANEVIDYFVKKDAGESVDENKERFGLFLAPVDNGRSWLAVDNISGDAWTEEFKVMEVALMWLRDECQAVEEAYAMDKLLSDKKRVIEVMRALFRRVFEFEEDRVAEALAADGINAEEALAFGFYLPRE